jgi:ABC-type Zn uptake system ZnuABC Zn-binding protein ZnuA
MTSPRALALALLLLLPPALAGCGDDDPAAAGPERVRVVATTTHAADLVRAVAGDRADITGLLPANADPHEYEVRPGDVQALADADLVVRSGGDLDGWLEDAIDSSGTGADELVLIDHVETIEGGHGHEEEEAEEHEAGEEEHEEGEEGEEEHEVDPHWWQDPRNAAKAVAAIEAALRAADPAGAAAYAAAAASYRTELDALDRAVAACIDAIPPAQRKLVTTHDALGYYADRYGLDVIGAVIPSLSTQAQASAGEVAELVETIRRERVRAIFAEASLDPRLERAVADDAGAEVGGALWADTLGPAGSDGDTYLKSIAANTRTIVDGLGGGSVRCDLPG